MAFLLSKLVGLSGGKPLFGGLVAKCREMAFPRVTMARDLSLQEYQGKDLMSHYDLRLQRFRVVSTPEEAVRAFEEFNTREVVIKAQILAGGRKNGVFANGFKGGVHVCDNGEEVYRLAKEMLGNRLITRQTSVMGAVVRRLIVAESVEIVREFYVSILMNSESNGPVFVLGRIGGTEIEELTQSHPEEVLKHSIAIESGPTDEDLRRMCEFLRFDSKDLEHDFAAQVKHLFRLFIELDATQVEVNPLAITSSGRLYCIDAKLIFDQNAYFRHPDIYAMRDKIEGDPRELAAQELNLSYVGMNGTIGCVVNGAGLAMATMDIIKFYDGDPANFLDIGGNASVDAVIKAFRVLLMDPNVRAILVNIFGGIIKCDMIAQGIIDAISHFQLKIPVIVRLAGTNVEIANNLLKNSGIPLIIASNLDDAVKKAISTANRSPLPK